MEYLCHKLPRICSVFHNHNPVLSLLMTYHQTIKKSDKTGATSAAGTAYPFGAPKSISIFKWGLCCLIFRFLCSVS
jgi:hypothetical protein